MNVKETTGDVKHFSDISRGGAGHAPAISHRGAVFPGFAHFVAKRKVDGTVTLRASPRTPLSLLGCAPVVDFSTLGSCPRRGFLSRGISLAVSGR
jgi:hypothetical protein